MSKIKNIDVYNEYKNNEVMTASQGKLIIMLYDAAIKNLKIAEYAIKENNIEKNNKSIAKTQDILTEFMSTLNFDDGGEVATNLYQMYEYMHHKLIRANIEKDIDAINEVRQYLEELRETWAQL